MQTSNRITIPPQGVRDDQCQVFELLNIKCSVY